MIYVSIWLVMKIFWGSFPARVNCWSYCVLYLQMDIEKEMILDMKAEIFDVNICQIFAQLWL